MWLKTALQALRERKRLEICYEGWTRIVELHAIGYSQDGNGLMLVWQVRGGSNSSVSEGWKLLRLDEMVSYRLVDERSEAPRLGYAGANKGITDVVAEL